MNIAIFCAFDTPATIEFAKATIAYLENKGHHLTLDQRLSTHLPEKAKAYDAFDAPRHHRYQKMTICSP